MASSTLQAETTALRERVAELEALLADALALQVRVCAVRLQPTWAVRGAQCSSSCPCLVLAAGLTPPVSWARFCCSVDSIKYSNMLTAAPPPLPVLQDENAGAANAAAAPAAAPGQGGTRWACSAPLGQLSSAVISLVSGMRPVCLPSSCAQGQARRQLGGGRLGRVARGCNLSCCHARLWRRLRNRPCGWPAGHQQRQPAMRTACGWECVTATFSRRDGGSSRPVR